MPIESLVLFGARTPLLPEYEEACAALGIEIAMIVSVDERASRSRSGAELTAVADLRDDASTPFIACAFSPYRRAELVSLATRRSLMPARALVHPSATIARSVRIGQGTFLNAGVVIGSVVFIGEHAVVNRATSIGHHAIIGDFASIGPGVTLTGNVRVGHGAFIGAGSVVVPGITIGDDAAVAAGSLVKQDVAPGTLVAGNPAAPRHRRPGPEMFAGEGEE